jgi:hypothetical protein
VRPSVIEEEANRCLTEKSEGEGENGSRTRPDGVAGQIFLHLIQELTCVPLPGRSNGAQITEAVFRPYRSDEARLNLAG